MVFLELFSFLFDLQHQSLIRVNISRIHSLSYYLSTYHIFLSLERLLAQLKSRIIETQSAVVTLLRRYFKELHDFELHLKQCFVLFSVEYLTLVIQRVLLFVLLFFLALFFLFFFLHYCFSLPS